MTRFAVMSLLQKNLPELDDVVLFVCFFFTSLEFWSTIWTSAYLCSVFPSFVCLPSSPLGGGGWFQWRFILGSSNRAWPPLMVTVCKGQLRLQEPWDFCLVLVFCTFQSPSHIITFSLWKQSGQALESLFCRWGNWGSQTTGDFPEVIQLS